jgi:DNA polymerase III delta prime subunit
MEEFLWVEKYRPKTVEETILTKELKDTFQNFVDKKSVPNLILAGPAGVGKTTVAKAMLEELDCDYIVINGSMNGNIDTLRVDIQRFASSMSLVGGRKYVILDEADYLNPNSTQPALRNFMEEFSKNCGFILTCNYKNRIIQPLHSRCSVIDFKFDGDIKMELAAHMPDNRRILNELQRYSANGKIDSGILAEVKDISLSQLVDALKNKKFTEVRKWVAHNLDNDTNDIFRKIYDTASDFLEPNSVPAIILILADYQNRAAFVADHEINLVACLTEIMMECSFK